jgi:hypothetical protein
MVQAAPHTDELDEYLKVLVQAVKGACTSAAPRIKDDPAAVERALTDCEEMLNTVMEGKVEEWVG